MQINIDDALADLAATPPDPRLAGLEKRVLDAIAAQPAAVIGTETMIAAVAVALALGFVSNIVPTKAPSSPTALSPIGAPSPLAPSTLLVG